MGIGAQIADIVDFNLSVYIDLADYVGLTQEGWNGDWVTIWLRGSMSGLTVGFPLSVGIDNRQFDLTGNFPDREFPVEFSLLNTEAIGASFSAITFTINGAVEIGGLTAGGIGAGVSAFNIQSASRSIEVQRQSLDNALSNAFFPGLSPSVVGYRLMTHLFEKDLSTTSNGGLNDIAWRFTIRTPSDKTDNSN